MPVQIYAEINGNAVKTYHIARVEKNVSDDEWTDYQVIEDDADKNHSGSYSGPSYNDWDDYGIIFQHRRKDGLNQLIIRALTALENCDTFEKSSLTES